MRDIELIITDLDDTIWTWQAMWEASFIPYLNRISQTFGIPLPTLKADFKKLHEKYGSSEVSYAYRELASIEKQHQAKFEKGTPEAISIIHEYYRNRKTALKLFDGVFVTLKNLKLKGTRIIGFTESNVFYTKQRLKHLHLDKLFDRIYSPEDHGLPPSVERYYPAEYWEPESVAFYALPRGTKKPNPDILLKIIRDQKADHFKTIYIGDKPSKDILMANQAKVTSVLVTYGGKTNTENYDLLREVTHWTEEDVNKEKEPKSAMVECLQKEDFSIANFSDLLNHFNFIKFDKYSDSDKSNLVEIWKTTTEVNKHFNDIEMRIRGLAMTLFTFLFTAIGFAVKENSYVEYQHYVFHLGMLISFFGCVGMFAFYFMDELWYHRLLVGSVNKAAEIEKDLKTIYPSVDLAVGIRDNSPLSFFGLEIRSKHKIRIFYLILIISFLAVFISLLCLKPKTWVNLEYQKIQKILNAPNYSPEAIKKVAGIVLKYDLAKNFQDVQETDNLLNFSESFARDTNSVYYYVPLENNRKEIEELISKNPIEIK